MYQINFYVPVAHADRVKMAMFDCGAGKIGNYDRCAFQVEGLGQYRPLAGSNPFIGKTNELNTALELKVEMVCKKEIITDVIEAMKKAHPYEEVAYHVLKCEEF